MPVLRQISKPMKPTPWLQEVRDATAKVVLPSRPKITEHEQHDQKDHGNRGGKKKAPVTKTKEFKKWFADSKVVDADGEPLLVHHVTTEEFEEFDPSKSAMGGTFWFTSSKASIESGETGAGLHPDKTQRTIDAYLSVQKMAGWDEYEKYMLVQLEDMGYDGVKLVMDKSKPDAGADYIVFDPTQIKSATGNVGTFDPKNPNITEHEPGGHDQKAHGNRGGGPKSPKGKKPGKAKGKKSLTTSEKKAPIDHAAAANRINIAMDPMRRYIEKDPAEETRDWQGHDQDDEFKDGVERELVAMANRYGLLVDRDYDAQSTYWDIILDSDEGVVESFQVRASNHTQRYGGTAWSFELADDLKAIELGLKHIEKEMQSIAPEQEKRP